MLLNNCKINFLESEIKIFVSYVSSLHSFKTLETYPKLMKSSLSEGYRKDKSYKNDLKKKVDFINRVKRSSIVKIKKSEKRYRKTILSKNYFDKDQKLQEPFGSDFKKTNNVNKYLKLQKSIKKVVGLNKERCLRLKFEKLRLIRIFLLYYTLIKQERNRLKEIIYYKIKNCQNKHEKNSKTEHVFKQYLKSITKKKFKNENGFSFFLQPVKERKSFSKLRFYNFAERLVESLNTFVKTRFNIKFVFHEMKSNLHDMTLLNRNETNFLPYFLNIDQRQIFQKKGQLIKKIISQLRQYKKSVFFEEGLQIIFLGILHQSNPKLLSRFIATQFKSKKKHYFFFRFLKKTLSLFFINKLFEIKSIKIVIKGRINGSKRSKKRSITVGKQMPLMTLNSNIEYSKSTIYGPHGTFGVKI